MPSYSEGDAERGLWLQSDDGGASWRPAEGVLARYLEGHSVRVILLKSDDGGVTWIPEESP